jgi:hypothetical protein
MRLSCYIVHAVLFIKYVKVSVCVTGDFGIIENHIVMKTSLLEVDISITVLCFTFCIILIITYNGMNNINLVLASQTFICLFSNMKGKIIICSINIYFSQ